MIKPWTIALLILIIVDSVVTTYIGAESNPLILWIMNTFDLTLKEVMIARIIYCIPFLLLLNWKDWSRFTFLAYVGIYFVVGII